MANNTSQKSSSSIVLTIAVLGLFLLLAGAIGGGAYYFMYLNAATYMKVDKDALYFKKAGGKEEIQIDYDGYTWSVHQSPNWVDIDKQKNALSVEVNKNSSGEDREGVIVLKSGRVHASISVEQKGKVTFIKPSWNHKWITEEGGEFLVDIESDGCDLECRGFNGLDVQKMAPTQYKLIVPSNGQNDPARYLFARLSEDDISVDVEIEQRGVCLKCNATGIVDCPSCKGSGDKLIFFDCSKCNGTGKITCDHCGGTMKGYVHIN